VEGARREERAGDTAPEWWEALDARLHEAAGGVGCGPHEAAQDARTRPPSQAAGVTLQTTPLPEGIWNGSCWWPVAGHPAQKRSRMASLLLVPALVLLQPLLLVLLLRLLS